MHRPFALLFVCSLALLAAACSSTGSSNDGAAARVQYRDRSGQKLTILNDSWLIAHGVAGETPSMRRAAFASEVRQDVTMKVTEDELVAGLVEALESQGFAKYATSPSASAAPKGALLEVERDGRTRQFLASEGLPLEALRTFSDCRSIFIEVYNQIDFFQAADQSQLRLDPTAPKR